MKRNKTKNSVLIGRFIRHFEPSVLWLFS